MKMKVARVIACVVLLAGAAALCRAGDPPFNPGPGSVLCEYWREISGTAITDLTGNADYPDSPTEYTFLKEFEIPSDQADNYGTRVRGYVIAPDTGDYTFWIASDDNGELWLSNSEDPKGKQKIGSVSEWTGSREWEKYPSQKSKPIHLEKDKKYYIEALQKEGGGGDNLAVAWQLPNGTKEQPIPGSRLAPMPPPKIQPQSQTVTVSIKTAPPDSPGTHPITGTFNYKGKDFPFGFAVYLPAAYFDSKEKYPLVTSMHNVVGEVGGVTGGPEILYEGMALLMQKDIGADDRHSGEWPKVKFNPRKDAQFIGLLPQCPKDRAFQSMPMSAVIIEEINWVEKNFRMDSDRVYLTGFSYGGSCTWAVAMQFPERFAAIVPLSARIAPKAETAPDVLKDLGIWCGVGELDGDFRSACDKMNEILTKAKHPNFHYTVVKGGYHHCYQSIYGNPDFWKWLLAQKRKPK